MNKAANDQRTRREEYAEATRQALLAAGREIFAREGYQAAGIEAISRAARVTRGAFYHHFEDKKALFDAVVVSLQSDAAARVQEISKRKSKLWERLYTGIDAYLDVSIEPAYARIVVQEAPVVLGNARFAEIEEQYPMALLKATLRVLKREGELVFDDIDLLGHMLDAVICELSIKLPTASDPKKTRVLGRKIIEGLLDSFRRK
ncbi:TetR/AcrR family transcriptional regulator [Bradyrhizobium glycinis]|uniref:TetR/AcrR family transcriptional regulator n=1 Tax=Bradyrhizobium glycinis TaxID=2751812 RepID=UPI0018D74217|nr:TetR/AcrR family transcriptional regulator [Bradyrhizobium glycinis]MBH5370248.1 TetR/AcrR family transcriptional regulator [Bradyrhizobium glycinis]